MREKGQVKRIRSKPQNYSLTFKKMVVEEYLSFGVSKDSLLKKHGIKSKGAIQQWLKLFELPDKWIIIKSLQINTDIALMSKASTSEEPNIAVLKKRIVALEQALLDEQIRLFAANRTIEIAEEELKIPIRKKHNTK